MVWIGADFDVLGASVSWFVAMVTVGAGLLMVSNFRFHSFKDLNVHGRVPFVLAVAVMLVFALIFIQPPVILFVGFMSYAISGPVLTLVRRRQRLSQRRRGRPGTDAGPGTDHRD